MGMTSRQIGYTVMGLRGCKELLQWWFMRYKGKKSWMRRKRNKRVGQEIASKRISEVKSV